MQAWLGFPLTADTAVERRPLACETEHRTARPTRRRSLPRVAIGRASDRTADGELGTADVRRGRRALHHRLETGATHACQRGANATDVGHGGPTLRRTSR